MQAFCKINLQPVFPFNFPHDVPGERDNNYPDKDYPNPVNSDLSQQQYPHQEEAANECNKVKNIVAVKVS